MRNRLRPTAVAGIAAVTLLAGCHSNSTAAAPPASVAPTSASPAAPASAGQPTAAPATGGASAGGSDPGAGPASGASVRVINLLTLKGQPGPALDIYDVPLQGQPATPILTSVAYGSVSAYAQPHILDNSLQKIVELFALPAGEDPATQKGDSAQIGGLIDDGSGAQMSIVLSGSDDDTATGTSLIGAI